eukprot:CAMPEP_0197067378 /NCGR_PEP_ID=MMETSP1384-20130603/179714_1 /TAXON_ID=29189 /ORGANISM="Ammonia sp." /LENGTH=189 /DNA_ID=CAMNT_0042504815 /DNA_START=112 /DNA_END=681 /DNA_ORIENTATION=-
MASHDIPKCPRTLLTQRSLPGRLSIIENRNEIVRIDELLGLYYRQFGRNDYFQTASNDNGRFLEYIMEHNLINIRLSNRLDLSKQNPETADLTFIYFDPHFPLSNETVLYINKHGISKQQVILYIIYYCYKYNAYPTPNRFLQYMVIETPRESLRNLHQIMNSPRSGLTPRSKSSSSKSMSLMHDMRSD